MQVAFLGLGLIGGSVARALHAAGPRTAWSIAAWTPEGRGPAQAMAVGVIDRAAPSPEEAIAGADLIVLAGPVPVCLEQLALLAGPWAGAVGRDAVITDVASTKGALVRRASELGTRFVGGHPMAGRETSGYAAASPDLFVGRPWVLTPSDGADDDAIARVEALAAACGARPVRMDADEHDQAVAAISHVPLVVAAALVVAMAGDARSWPTARELAAGGWRDSTRLARGDAAMGAGMLTTNTPAVAARLRSVIAELEDWLEELGRADGPDHWRVEGRLRAARSLLEAGES